MPKRRKCTCIKQTAAVKERTALEPTLWDETVALHHKKGIVSRRSSIKRAVLTHESSETMADMNHIPDALKFFITGRCSSIVWIQHSMSTILN
ncbi:hypothetical protein Y032_0448g1648 [Ancylostoma ceylanicum]|nr:hypothetical protein Y032_0448g1648 [Ancylostoma ceylanicum]